MTNMIFMVNILKINIFATMYYDLYTLLGYLKVLPKLSVHNGYDCNPFHSLSALVYTRAGARVY